MIGKKMKTIDKQADVLYKKFKALEVATERAKKELMEHMASLPEGHTSSFCSYVKEGTVIDRKQLGLYGAKFNIEVPMTETIDWKCYERMVKLNMDAFDQLDLYKAKKAYLRGMK